MLASVVVFDVAVHVFQIKDVCHHCQYYYSW